jgi:acylpyruvate hydrolase
MICTSRLLASVAPGAPRRFLSAAAAPPASLLMTRSTPKILAVGRNYADHAKELGNKVPSAKGAPLVFLKPPSSIVLPGEKIVIPKNCIVHHEGLFLFLIEESEVGKKRPRLKSRRAHDRLLPHPRIPGILPCTVELGIVIGSHASCIPAASALSHVSGFLLCLDLTARNLQDHAKKTGGPWTVAKGLDSFTPISEFVPRDRLVKGGLEGVGVRCSVNGVKRQDGRVRDMIFSYVSFLFFASSAFYKYVSR